MSRITTGAVGRATTRMGTIGTSGYAPSMTAITAARGNRREETSKESEPPGWLSSMGMTDWQLAGTEGASGTVGFKLSAGIGAKRMRFEHPEHGGIEVAGGGVVGSLGVGLPGLTLSGSTYDMFSRNIGKVFTRPIFRRELRPRDFSGFLNVVSASCAGGAGYGLTLFIFSTVPLAVGSIGWMTVRAMTAAHGMSLATTIGCSVSGKVYYMSLVSR